MKLDLKSCLKIGIVLFVLIICIIYLPSIGSFLLSVISAASPLLIGAVIAYLVNILMVAYEKIYFPKSKKEFVIKTRRVISLILAFLSLIIIIALIIWLVVPELVSCISVIINKIPGAIKTIVAKLDEMHVFTQSTIDYLKGIDWQSRISQFIEIVTSGLGSMYNIVIGTITSVFSGIVTALIATIFSVYLLTGKQRIKRQYTKLMGRFVKESIVKKINHVLYTMDDCFRRYIIGQCTEALILGILCMLGMLLLRLPYATMIGALIAFTALIPIAGAYIGAFVGAFMIFTVSPVKALIFLIFLIILQQLEGNIIYPRVVGSSIGLPGIWVLAAVTVGGGMLGVVGMLLGVPLAATAYRLLSEEVNKKKADTASQEEIQTE